jgi:hypothetical protein
MLPQIFKNQKPLLDSVDDCVIHQHLANSIMTSMGDRRLDYLYPAYLTPDHDLWKIVIRCMVYDPNSRPKTRDLREKNEIPLEKEQSLASIHRIFDTTLHAIRKI